MIQLSDKICEKVKCEYYQGNEIVRFTRCIAAKCPANAKANFVANGCPVPKKCKYKNLHIIEGQKIAMTLICNERYNCASVIGIDENIKEKGD